MLSAVGRAPRAPHSSRTAVRAARPPEVAAMSSAPGAVEPATPSGSDQLTAGIALIIGIANFTFTFGQASFGGIIVGTIAAIVVYHLMDVIGRARGTDEPSTEVADPAHAATGAVPAEPRAD